MRYVVIACKSSTDAFCLSFVAFIIVMVIVGTCKQTDGRMAGSDIRYLYKNNWDWIIG